MPTVVVADRDPLARRAVKDLLRSEGITVVAEAGSRGDAVDLVRFYHPDVLVLDLMLHDGARIDGAGRTALLVLGVDEDIDTGFRVLRDGARGYVSKGHGLASLPATVRSVARGEAVVPAPVVARLVDWLQCQPRSGAGVRPVRSPLTAREWEVLDALCAGASVEDAALEFVLSVETVRSHVKSILRKLGVHSQHEAIEAANRIRDPFADPSRALAGLGAQLPGR